MSYILECKKVFKSFGKTEAVKDVTFQLERDKIYGLLGRNGAGKTTLLQLISAQYIKDDGAIKIENEDVFENSKALGNLCFVKERNTCYEDKKIKDIFTYAKIFYKNWDEKFKDRLIEEFELDVKKSYKHLSRGMQSVVAIIIGLASRAPLTIFDEPSLGLDAAFRDKFYQIILEDYEKNKRTIILSTHLIDEVSNIFEEILIMDKGKIKFKDKVERISEKAFYLTGNAAIIEEFTKNKKVLNKEVLGNTIIAAIWGEWSQEEKERIKAMGSEITKIPLQKLFIYMTDTKNTICINDLN
jgi:ABC-2 type transport system ATP-binding protein